MNEGLRPSLAEYGDWKERINRISFITGRNEVVRTGTEAIVYRPLQENVVIKEFIKDKEKTRAGYEIAARLLPDIIAPFEFIKDFPIRVDFRQHVVSSGVAQEKVRPLDKEFANADQQKSESRLIEIVRKHMAVDREILKKNVFLPDPGFANYGIDRSGKVVLIDPGGIITSFTDIAQYMAHANGRGKIHYSHYLALKAIGQAFGIGFGQLPLEDLYTQESGLNFDPALSSLQQLMTILSPNPHIFSQLFWEVGQQEFEKFAPNHVSRDPQERYLQILKDNSII